MSLMRSILLQASESRWLARNLPRYPFARRAVLRFMPGEELSDALGEAARLAETGVGSVVTRLGENIANTAEAEAVAAHYASAIDEIARRRLPVHLSVKPTQLGLDISAAQATQHTAEIAEHSAARLQAPVWIDMESSRYGDATLDLFHHTHERHHNLGICLQAYLHRTEADLNRLLEKTTAIRLVKGAYKEDSGVALQEKRAVDENYLKCAERMLMRAQPGVVGHAPAFATHDVAIIKKIKWHADKLGVPRQNYEFQMLYGINRDEQRSLSREGYRLRVLISYGSAWFAWYMRRLAERPENVWFALRSVLTP
jgi:proline dehydrogenase